MSKTDFSNLASREQTQWILVGDASRFLIFEKARGTGLVEKKTFANKFAHLKISDLESDQPGRSFDNSSKSHGGHQTGAPRHAYTNEQDPKEHALENFVNEVSAFLDKEWSNHSFKHLVLIVDDRILGRLRASLDKSTQAAISAVHTKDLAWISGTDLEKRVEALLTVR